MSLPSNFDKNILKRWFNQIVESHQQKRCQFLFGAGMSYLEDDSLKETNTKDTDITFKKDTSIIPLSEGLLRKLMHHHVWPDGGNKPSEEQYLKLIGKYPFELIVQTIRGEQIMDSKSDFRRELEQIFIQKATIKPKSYDAFESFLYAYGDISLMEIFTTNFDNQFVNALGKDKCKSIYFHNYYQEYYQAIKDKKIRIVHLHGGLEENTDYQITESELFENGDPRFRSLFERALFDSKAFVFVGYSLNDPDLKAIYRTYLKVLKERTEEFDHPAYIVAPADNEFDYEIGSKIWKERKIKWIPLNASEFFIELLQFIRSKGDIEDIEDLCKDLKKSKSEIEKTIADFMGSFGYDRAKVILMLKYIK